MNGVIMSFDPNEKQSVICKRSYERMRAVESDNEKSATKAKDKLHCDKACQRASETREQTFHKQKQNRMRTASMRESRDSKRSEHCLDVRITVNRLYSHKRVFVPDFQYLKPFDLRIGKSERSSCSSRSRLYSGILLSSYRQTFLITLPSCTQFTPIF